VETSGGVERIGGTECLTSFGVAPGLFTDGRRAYLMVLRSSAAPRREFRRGFVGRGAAMPTVLRILALFALAAPFAPFASSASAQCTSDAMCSGTTPICNTRLMACVPGVAGYTERFCSNDGTFGGTDGWRNNLATDSWTSSPTGGITSFRDEGGSWAGGVDEGEDFLLAGGSAVADYEITTRVANDDDDGVGLVARYTGPGSYYACFYNNNSTPGCGTTPPNELKILEVDSTVCPGGARPFQRAATPFVAATTAATVYTMNLRVVGGEVTCRITDGAAVDLTLTFTDPTPRPAGEFGLYAYDNGLIEGGITDPLGAEVFDDFVFRSLEPDADFDGLPASVETAVGTSATSADTDGDGLSDGFELGPSYLAPLDTDGDGIINALDTDSDGDGLGDGDELALTPFVPPVFGDNADCVRAHLDPSIARSDFDRDGVLDPVDADSDNDGIPDAIEAPAFAGDPDGDSDGDGVPNWNDPDSTPGGCTTDGGTPALCRSGTLSTSVDADGDGRPNHLDLDSDGDGITDSLEARLNDSNGDGRPQACTAVDAAGVCSAGGLAGAAPNSDGAGEPDFLDLDSDGDGLSDAIEAFDSNGNRVINGAEVRPLGTDGDRDGLDDSVDPDAGGREITTPLSVARDANRNAIPDWRETCVDGYVTGGEACDDGDANDGNECNNMCLRNVGEPCTMGSECASAICDPTTMACEVCTDTTTGGVDDGCMMAMPACVVIGGRSECAACEDSAAGTGMDDGCLAAAPLCNPSTNTCSICLDSGSGVMDFGCMMAAPVCDTASMGGRGSCILCENDDPGPTTGDVDFGCSVAGPFCTAGMCRACVLDANCDDMNECTSDACTAGTCGATSLAAGTLCRGGADACDGAGTCADCVNTGLATDAGCSGDTPFCDAPMGAAGVCIECLGDGDCGPMEFCSPLGECTTGCDDDADCPAICDEPAMLCVACIDTVAMGMDDGCMGVTRVCAGAPSMGMAGTECAECTLDDESACAGEVCGTANTCVPCVDTGDGVDRGCTAVTPICDISGAIERCVGCLTDDDCRGGAMCVDDRCSSPDTDDDGVPDDEDVDDDNDGIVDASETGTDLSRDGDMDGIADYADPDVVSCADGDGDGACDALPSDVDFDADGVPNHLDLDSDGDGIRDSTEGFDADGDGSPDVPVPSSFADGDGDGLADAYDPDDGGTTAPLPDHDGDSRRDFLDGDSDDDGLPDHLEAFDADGDGRQDRLPLGIDLDGDGIDDAIGEPASQDTDGDGRPDYLDVDSDGDGIRDQSECEDPTRCSDTDGDRAPDYLDLDSDADGRDDATEGHDADADGTGDRTAEGADTDGDGLDDAFDPDSGGMTAPLPDHDGDRTADFRDPDDDGDLAITIGECDGASCADGDGDGTPDYLDPDTTPLDTDMDGIPDPLECAGGTCPDSDGDGMTDDMDPDDDGDGIATGVECAFGPAACESDGDGRPDHLDVDSDGDGIRDAIECTTAPCEDTDRDRTPDYRDLDTDGDGVGDSIEGHDADADGEADRGAGGADANDNGLDDAFDGDAGGTEAPLPDRDGDGDDDFRDADDDGDMRATGLECAGGACPDGDGDGTPDYLDADGAPLDTDGDGIPDLRECPPPGDPIGDPTRCPDTDRDGRPNFDDPDDDQDGIPTRDESYDADGDPTDDDSDRDGRPDYLDPDDDNDGIPTAGECADFAAGCADADMDGTADYLDVCGDGTRTTWDAVTSWEECDDGNLVAGDGCSASCRFESGDPDDDMDGLPNTTECPPPADWRTDPDGCPDTDMDGMPDFRDPDDDNDTIPTIDELGPGMTPQDTDMDGRPNHQDDDDDDDGIPTRQEIEEGRALTTPDDDVDDDGRPNWLDTDSDGDGVPDMSEPTDGDGNGVPDYLEVNRTSGGVAGGALCSSGGDPAAIGALVIVCGLLLRRRRWQ
jgi:cysteine-rich repeat protein